MLERVAQADRSLLWVLAVFLSAIALHIDRLPLWCTVAIVMIAVWRVLAAISAMGMPRNLIRVALGTALLVAVLAQFSTISGLAAGTALLAAMGAVKLLETRNRRDHYIVLGVSLFLMLAACLDRQSLLRVPLYGAHTWLACAALCAIAAPGLPISPRVAFQQAARALGYALPIALLLFLFFPRFQGQIWSLPGNGSAVTGLSNEMSPGAISQLSESDAPAFRVSFLGRRPPSTSLYWRGPVLHEFDGYTWRRQQGRISYRPALQYGGDEFRYRVTLEPHQRNWWFALDMPRRPPRSNVFFTFDYQLLAAQPVTQTVSYELSSHIQYRSREPISLLAQRMGLQLPRGRNPRSLAWARRERAAAGSDSAFVQRVLERFRDEGFVYSLTPPRLDFDSVDDFLFSTRSGFCGHYASAFVTLMRAAGIPARVVTGYHGGEWNPIGEYLLVRQSDAHAWGEIWVPGKGWSRVDPTGVVAPDRLRRAALDGLGLGAAARDVLVADLGWWPRAVLTWDAANTWWKTRVIDFDLRSQLSLMQRLGFDAPGLRELGWMLVAALALWLALVGLRFSRRPAAPPGDPLARSYQRLCRKLAAAGFARAAHEGPLDFSRRLADAQPALAATVAPLLTDYAMLRYGPSPAEPAVTAFHRAVRRIKKTPRLATPLEIAATSSLAEHSPLYRRLPASLQLELEPAIREFLDRVEFIGCGGLTITEPMRLIVALHAALLTRRIGIGAFRRLYSVLIYPDEFVVEQRIEDEDTGLVTEGSEVLSGQTIDTDRVIVSWRDVLEAEQADGPYNVIAHELAHYLDHAWDGALSSSESRSDWHDTLAAEHAALAAAVQRGEATLIDPYGAEDAAEFFCVATETMLEAPRELERRHSQLYAQLSRFYGLDPARWPDPAPARARGHLR